MLVQTLVRPQAVWKPRTYSDSAELKCCAPTPAVPSSASRPAQSWLPEATRRTRLRCRQTGADPRLVGLTAFRQQ